MKPKESNKEKSIQNSKGVSDWSSKREPNESSKEKWVQNSKEV